MGYDCEEYDDPGCGFGLLIALLLLVIFTGLGSMLTLRILVWLGV